MKKQKIPRKRRLQTSTNGEAHYPAEAQVRRTPSEIRKAGPQRMSRVSAQLILDDGIGRSKIVYPAAILLNEMNPLGTMLFSKQKFPRDQYLTLNIPNIHNFYIQGRVVVCKELTLNAGLLTAQSLPYRVELEWIFRSDAERAAVKTYCEFLAQQYLSRAA